MKSFANRARVFTMLSSALTISIFDASPALAQGEPSVTAADIIVTGSRVKRDGYDAPTPLTVVSADAINKAAPANLADYVNQMPQLAPSATTRTGNGNTSTGTNGLNLLDLRGLGSNRTLVMMDNQRVAPSTQTGAVDVNNIPTALVKRVDIVTGGASAAYGSDAVAGVVNFIVDRTFTGFKANLAGGVTGRGDNKGYQASFAYGTPFAEGRGHILASFEHEHQDGVDWIDPSKRAWYRKTYLVPNPAYVAGNGQPRQIVATNVNYNNVAQGGVITTTALKGTMFGANGAVSAFQYGTLAGNFMLGGNDWNEGNAIALSPKIDRDNAWGRASYDFGDVRASLEGSFGRSHVTNTAAYQRYAGNLTISASNAFLPSSVRTAASSAGVTSFGYGYATYDLGRPVNDITRQNYRVVGSLDGKLGNWNWNAYYQYGRTDLTINLRNTTNVANIAKAIDATTDSSGNIVCRSTLTAPTNGCVPLNIFGTGVASAAAIAYVKGTAWQTQAITQQVAAASISGDLAHTWAGPVSLAAGIEHRRESASAVGDDLSQTNGWYTGNYKTNAGGYHVTEAFAETVVPLVRGGPLGKTADFNAAARVTDYSTSGRVTTWKAGLTYEPVSDLRLRAVVSRDIRAPSITEQFVAGATQAADVVDPVKSGTFRITAITNGNLNLKPEKADTLSLGAVLRPSFIPGLSVSFDYYNIRVKDAITTLAVGEILNRCVAGETALCSYITRDSTNTITSIQRVPVNLATLRVRGYDIDATYRLPVDKIIAHLPGTLTLHVLATHQLNYTLINGSVITEYAGLNGGPSANPSIASWRTYTTLAYDNDTLSFQGTMRTISSGVYDNTWKSGVDIDNNTIEGATYFDLAGNYRLWSQGSRKAEAYFKIENLLDKDPPVAAGISSSALQTNPVLYDTLGRSFRLGVRLRY
jgi:iron complex outermembrane receptor protein